MTERRHLALEQAYREIPLRLSEVHPKTNLVPIGAAFLGQGIALNTIDAYHDLFTQNRPAFAVVGAALYVISGLVDRHSTHKFLDVADAAEAQGIKREHIEISPYIYGATTRKEQKSKKLLALDIFTTGLSALSPALASAFITGRLLAAKNNYRIAKRYSRAVEIAESQK